MRDFNSALQFVHKLHDIELDDVEPLENLQNYFSQNFLVKCFGFLRGQPRQDEGSRHATRGLQGKHEEDETSQ